MAKGATIGHTAVKVQDIGGMIALLEDLLGFQVLCLAVLADLLAGNRKLVEEALYRLRRLERSSDAKAPAPGDPESRGSAVPDPSHVSEHVDGA